MLPLTLEPIIAGFKASGLYYDNTAQQKVYYFLRILL